MTTANFDHDASQAHPQQPASSASNEQPSVFDTLIRKPSTWELQQPGERTLVPRAGTLRLGERVRLLMFVGTQPEPVQVEFVEQLMIGRSLLNADGPALDLDAYQGYLHGVSRRHAVFTRDQDLLYLTDLDSTNGTYLNGFQLTPKSRRLVRDGDEIALGQLVLRVNFADSDQPSAPPPGPVTKTGTL